MGVTVDESQQSEDRTPDSHPEPDSIVNWTEELDQAIDERFNDLVALRRHIHMHPHYCPAKSRIESAGWGHRVSFRGSRTAARL